MCACLLYCLPPCLAISTDATAAVAASAGTFFLLPPGMAGSGKTTLIQRVNSHMHQQKLNGYIINLDPAVSHLPYGANIDIRDTVSSLLQFRLRTSAAVQLPQRFLSKQYCIEQLLRLRQLRWQLRWPIVAEEMQKLCRTQDHVAAVSEQQQHGVRLAGCSSQLRGLHQKLYLQACPPRANQHMPYAAGSAVPLDINLQT